MSRTASKSTVRSLLRLLQTPSLAHHLQAKAVTMEKTATPAAKSSRYNAIQSFVLETIRKGMRNNGSNSSHQRLVLNRFHELQKDLHARAELYAMDTGAENQLDAREMSRRAAARAGLQLPILRDVEEDLRRDDENKK